jgi:hypothetical protein
LDLASRPAAVPPADRGLPRAAPLRNDYRLALAGFSVYVGTMEQILQLGISLLLAVSTLLGAPPLRNGPITGWTVAIALGVAASAAILCILLLNLLAMAVGVDAGTRTAILRVPLVCANTVAACVLVCCLLPRALVAVAENANVSSRLAQRPELVAMVFALLAGLLGRLAVAWVGIIRSLGTPVEGAVVFLRPFSQDLGKRDLVGYVPQTKIARHLPLVFLKMWYLFRRVAGLDVDDSLEARIARASRRMIGPVVALGAPGNWFPTLGAVKTYATGAGWRRAVSSMVGTCRCVIVSLGDGDGLEWELRHIRSRGDPLRTFLILGVDKLALFSDPEASWWFRKDNLKAMGFEVPDAYPGLDSVLAFETDWRARVVARKCARPEEFASAIHAALQRLRT